MPKTASMTLGRVFRPGNLFKTALSAFALLAGAAQAQERVGIVSFTVDNITTRFFENSMPVFFARDVPGTMFGQTKPITGEPGDLYWPEINELIDHGWEFGAHGYSHDMMSKMDDDTLELELGGPAAYIFRGTGIYPTSIATPNGDYDDRVLARIRVYYDAHFRGWGNDGINYFDSTDHYEVYRERMDNTKTVAEICADYERAGREGYWLVVMLHRIVETPEYEYENSRDQFEGAVDCAADLRERGILRLMTVRDALRVVPHTPKER